MNQHAHMGALHAQCVRSIVLANLVSACTINGSSAEPVAVKIAWALSHSAAEKCVEHVPLGLDAHLFSTEMRLGGHGIKRGWD